MVPLTDLWLPILVSAVFVFIASNILWMALPFWHYRDYKKVPNQSAFVDAAKSLASGLYIFPWMDWKTMTPEEKAAAQTGPSAMMIVRNPATFKFPKSLLLYFLYCLLGSVMAAYVAGATLAPGTAYMQVHRIAGTAGILFWAFGTNISDAIWYGKPWSVAIKHVIDGVIFGFLIGGTFGWLWPA
jgi:hypothetical protein